MTHSNDTLSTSLIYEILTPSYTLLTLQHQATNIKISSQITLQLKLGGFIWQPQLLDFPGSGITAN